MSALLTAGPLAAPRSRPIPERIWHACLHLIVVALCLVTVFPLLWMISTAFKEAPEIFLPGVRLLAQCKSCKHFTAVQINREIGASDEFWQSESFDHLVRDADHFERFRKYIAENREKAGLKADEGIDYRCPDS